MYKVIKFFTDLQDNNYAYNVGDKFPHNGIKVSDARFAELSSANNKQGVPLIKFEEDPVTSEASIVAGEAENFSTAIMNDPVDPVESKSESESEEVESVSEKKRGRKSK